MGGGGVCVLLFGVFNGCLVSLAISGLWVGLWAMSKVERSVRASPARLYPVGKLQ